MHRLQSERERLYLVPVTGGQNAVASARGMVSAQGLVRALVMELIAPPRWEELARVWQGVQDSLDLPAPGIAVSGVDALQLWFSLVAPVPVAQGHAFLEGLRRRFLADVDPARVRLLPAAHVSVADGTGHAQPVPSVQPGTGNWSAFVAPDLAPVFGDTPWLDIPPGDEGQANLLQVLASIEPVRFEAACREVAGTPVPLAAPAAGFAGATDPGADAHGTAPIPQDDPRKFLLQVMQDSGAPLALRIEAAKALLAHGEPSRPARGV